MTDAAIILEQDTSQALASADLGESSSGGYLFDLLSGRSRGLDQAKLDDQLKRRALIKLTQDALSEAMGSAVETSGNDTDAYRRVGDDSLTYGRTGRWIVTIYMPTLVDSDQMKGLDVSVPDFQTQPLDLPIVTIYERYQMDNRGQVMGYLERYSWLPRFLVTAAEMLDRYFPQGTKYVLEFFTDPEQEDWDELFVNIRSELPIDEALDRLDAFDSDWFLDQIDKVGGVVNFNVE